MTAIALVIFIASIVYVMIWSIKNEDARSIGDQTGIIKMRDPSNAARKSAGRFGHRRQVSGSPPSEQTNRRN